MNGGRGDFRLFGFLREGCLPTIAKSNAIRCKSTKTKQATRLLGGVKEPGGPS
jgi:hypothetical protein